MSVNLPKNPLAGKRNLKPRLSKAKKEHFAKASGVLGRGGEKNSSKIYLGKQTGH